MPKFMDTTGHSVLGIGICDRCSQKFSLDDLYSDPNSPGLKVCLADLDNLDPWRLPPREPEDITLPFYRPDVNIAVDNSPSPTARLIVVNGLMFWDI